MTPRPIRSLRARTCTLGVALGTAGALAGTLALAQGGVAPTAAPTRPVASSARTTAPAEEGVRWTRLKPAQQEALKPLQQEWGRIDALRKQKWLEIADRLPGMSLDERTRVQARMSEWARLTPTERGQARLSFQETKQIPASDRRSRWEAYQALSADQKSELAARAAASRAPAASPDAGRRPDAAGSRSTRFASEGPQTKSNIVPNPALATPLRPVGPTVVQAAPGATTTLLTRRPAPPPHQHTGLPKIAATPEFVNRSTLLPQRGPQGAAVRAPTPSEPSVPVRR